MRGKIVIHLLFVTGLAAALLVAGCLGTGQSPPSRFYMLTSLDQADDAPGNPAGIDDEGIRILLGPIRFPVYLSRQQIVFRTSPNEIRLAEFDRWAEPLETNFLNVLKENLSILLNTAYIVEPPVPREIDIEFQVVAGVTRFDAEPGERVVLRVRWAIIRADDDQVLMGEKSTYAAQLSTSEFEEIVGAQSLILADFSRDVASAIENLYRTEHGQ